MNHTPSTAAQGSRILNAWRAERQGAKAATVRAENDVETGLTAEQLYERLVGMSSTWAGPPVTEEIAMREATVYGCTQLLAGVISSIPLPVYERTADGRNRIDHEYWWLLNEQMNQDISSAVGWSYFVRSMILHGDGFMKIERASVVSSRIVGLTPLHPQRVHPFRSPGDGRLLYQVTPLTGTPYVLDPADIIHVPTLGFDGLRSCSPVTYAARQSIGVALAAEEYSARFFSEGAHSDIVLKHKSKIDKDTADSLKAAYMARNTGLDKNRSPIVLQGGLELEQISITPNDAALLPTRFFTAEQLCRVIGVPPDMVGHTQTSTSWGTGVEQRSIGFVKFGLMPRLVAIAQELNRKLWPSRARYYVEHNTAALERGDYKTRMEGYRILAGRAGEAPVMRVDEIRKLENLPPDPELQALQLELARKSPAAKSAKEPAGEEPAQTAE